MINRCRNFGIRLIKNKELDEQIKMNRYFDWSKVKWRNLWTIFIGLFKDFSFERVPLEHCGQNDD